MITGFAPFITQLKNEVEYGENGMHRKILVKDENRQAMLLCLKAGTHIPEHVAHHDGFMVVVEGRGILKLDGKETALEPGVFIALHANTPHDLTALENLAMLKVVDSHDCEPH